MDKHSPLIKCISLSIVLLLVGGSWTADTRAQTNSEISFQSVEPVSLRHQSFKTNLLHSPSYKHIVYAVLSPSQVREAAYIYGVKPEKVVFQTMWFYDRKQLENMPIEESVAQAVDRLSQLQLKEPHTRAMKPNYDNNCHHLCQ